MGPLLRETFRAMFDRIDRELIEVDLSLSKWLAIRLIVSDGPVTIGDVSKCLGIDTGATTRLIDRLEDKQLIARARSDTDRRVVVLTATPAGHALREQLQPRVSSFWREQLSGFTDLERDTLFALMARLRDKLRTN